VNSTSKPSNSYHSADFVLRSLLRVVDDRELGRAPGACVVERDAVLPLRAFVCVARPTVRQAGEHESDDRDKRRQVERRGERERVRHGAMLGAVPDAA